MLEITKTCVQGISRNSALKPMSKYHVKRSKNANCHFNCLVRDMLYVRPNRCGRHDVPVVFRQKHTILLLSERGQNFSSYNAVTVKNSRESSSGQNRNPPFETDNTTLSTRRRTSRTYEELRLILSNECEKPIYYTRRFPTSY